MADEQIPTKLIGLSELCRVSSLHLYANDFLSYAVIQAYCLGKYPRGLVKSRSEFEFDGIKQHYDGRQAKGEILALLHERVLEDASKTFNSVVDMFKKHCPDDVEGIEALRGLIGKVIAGRFRQVK